jgi:hypothetical protein
MWASGAVVFHKGLKLGIELQKVLLQFGVVAGGEIVERRG